MGLLEALFSVGRIRKFIWEKWYPYLTRRSQGRPVLFLNYAYEESPPLGVPLRPEDEPDRGCIQLYHHAAAQADLRGKDVLEVGCGHGGGAAYVARALGPRRMTGVDLNPAGIRFCRETHRVKGLSFQRGDAEALPFPEASFDAVLNVESSHCYPDFPRFLSETARTLKSGGVFLYADFRFAEDVPAWEAALAAAPLTLLGKRDISMEVLRGMEMNSDKSAGLVRGLLPPFLQKLGRDFAGVKGSRVYEALKGGRLSYRSYCFRKD